MYEYAWMDPASGQKWLDGYQPVGITLVRVRRLVGDWEELYES